jgi:hypothetical protein
MNELTTSKQRLARAHEDAVRTFARDPEGLAILGPEDISRLRDITKTFEAASVENSLALRIAISASDAVAGTMVQAINLARELEAPAGLPGGTGYGRGRAAPATTYNQVL